MAALNVSASVSSCPVATCRQASGPSIRVGIKSAVAEAVTRPTDERVHAAGALLAEAAVGVGHGLHSRAAAVLGPLVREGVLRPEDFKSAKVRSAAACTTDGGVCTRLPADSSTREPCTLCMHMSRASSRRAGLEPVCSCSRLATLMLPAVVLACLCLDKSAACLGMYGLSGCHMGLLLNPFLFKLKFKCTHNMWHAPGAVPARRQAGR